jgi:uncharacterized protein YdhG (YjbR/CyaY superfamily)
MNTQQKPEFKNVDEYIALQPVHIRPTLEQLRQVIKEAAPEAEEIISYRMPAYRFHGMLCFFAAFKDHYSFFVSPGVLIYFKDRLTAYKVSKGTLRIPEKEPVPEALISDIVKYAASLKLEKAKPARGSRRAL